MNCIEMFKIQALAKPDKMALCDGKGQSFTFSQMMTLSAKAQSLFLKYGVQPGDSVLVAVLPSPEMYASLCALMGLGVRIIFIEPWLSLDRINHVIQSTKPKIFFTSMFGKIWGVRSKEIRGIPHWVTPKMIQYSPKIDFHLENLPPDHHAVVAFSSGTTGTPKGAIRTHQYMKDLKEIFLSLQPHDFQSPELVIFPNVALFHLATGRGSIVVPHKWSKGNLKSIFSLCEKYKPETLSAGPSFYKTLLEMQGFERLQCLKQFVIGGALTDCWIMEETFKAMPGREFHHIYGGSEAEPVAICDAQVAVKESQQKGFFQMLYLGEKIKEIDIKLKEDILWVKGPNVAPEYIGDPKDNIGVKERDEHGLLWHCMGDRVHLENNKLWLQGRQTQKKDDFLLEQKLYSLMQNSAALLQRCPNGDLALYGESVLDHLVAIKKEFPQIKEIHSTKIVRDKRHRSRIDRKNSIPKKYRGSL